MNDLTLTLLDLLLKGSALLCLGIAMRFVWRRSSASQRSWVWLVIFATLLVLPAGIFLRPVWPVHVVIEPPAAPILISESPVSAPVTAPQAPMAAQVDTGSPWTIAVVLVLLYLLGGALVMGYRLLGSLQLARLRRGAKPVAKDSRLGRVFEQFAPGRARLLLSSEIAVPMTWGIWHPVVLLPAASESWREAEVQAALHHELAHVRHRDPSRRWLGTLVCALWWPLPLAWLASRAWKLEQELACDDAVLRSGTDPEAYAIQLLSAARQWQQHRSQTAAALVMAMPAGLETRLRSVVSDTVNRTPVGRGAASLVILTGVCFALLAMACRAQLMAAETGKTIQIQAKFIEVDPTLTSKFGLPASGSATLTGPQMRELLRQMSLIKGVDLLSAPRLEAKSGQAARVEVVREFGPPPGGSALPARAGLKGVGVTLDVVPREIDDGSLSLDLAPRVRDFLGFKTPALKPGEKPEPVFAEATWKGTVPLRPREWYLQRLATPPDQASSGGRQKWVLVAAETVMRTDEVAASAKPKATASEPSVTIYGQVKRQGKYTLRAGMTLDDLIQEAQGLSPSAGSQADLWRGSQDSVTLHVIELPSGTGFALQDGDRVTIHTKPPAAKTTSSLREDVEAPFTNPSIGALSEDQAKRQQAAAQLELLRKRSQVYRDMVEGFDNTELNYHKTNVPLNATDPDSMWRQQVDRANEVLRSQGLGTDQGPTRGRL